MTDIFSRTDFFSKVNLFARSSRSSYSSGMGAGALFIWMLFYLICYVYMSLVIMFIAKKTSTSNSWMAWVPILNIYLLCKAAGKSIAWFILMFIPFINIIAVVIVWAAVAERLGKPAWWGILMLVPGVNLVIPAILAFTGGSPKVSKISKKTVSKGGMTCPKCGASISPTDKFCPDCGAKKANGKFCPKCGARVAGTFCSKCGTKI